MGTVHTDWGAAHDDPRQLSTADLLKRFTNEATGLVRKEIELAKAELSEKGKEVGVGGGLLAGAAVAALAAIGALTACLILALAEVMPGAVAALIVMILWAVVGAVLALLGRDRMREAAPVAPKEATQGLKEDVRVAKDGIRAGRAGELNRGGLR
jgi:uncharacterized membrane protein YqjE